MLNGFNENGELKGVRVTDNGELLVKNSNNSSSPIPVNGEVISKSSETTLYASILTLNTFEQTIGLSNQKVTEISIANYSETANVLVSVDDENYTIAPNLAVDLPVNKNINLVGLSATETNVKVQYIIKGEE